VHGRLELLVAFPVAVGLLDDNGSLEQQPLEDAGDVELVVARITHAQCDVFEVAKQGEIGCIGP